MTATHPLLMNAIDNPRVSTKSVIQTESRKWRLDKLRHFAINDRPACATTDQILVMRLFNVMQQHNKGQHHLLTPGNIESLEGLVSA